MANIYPKSIYERLRSRANLITNLRPNSMGKSVALECGTLVEFEVAIEPESKLIEEVSFRSNGCGYMIAAAFDLAVGLKGKHLTELRSLSEFPDHAINERLGPIPPEREHCRATVVAAVKDALANFRQNQVEEFAGEKALVCTCFGVTEETVESAIKVNLADSVARVGESCKAGTGCGSCQMMIQDIIDSFLNGK